MDPDTEKPQLNEDADDSPEIDSPELDPPAPGKLMVKEAPPPRAPAEVAASHRVGSPGGRVFNLVLPTVSTATSEKQAMIGAPEYLQVPADKGGAVDFPVIPPRGISEIATLPGDPAEQAVWFRVLTPREIKGIEGPFSEVELKELYKTGNLKDSTLLWKEGEKDWKELLKLTELRPRLLQKPILPPRVGRDAFDDLEEEEPTYSVDDRRDAAAFNPVISLPTGAELENLKALHSIPMTNPCSRCGSFAVGHLAGVGRNEVDLFSLRSLRDYPRDLVSEIIPGLMYVGASGSAKLNTLLEMNISMLINCTNNMNNPPDRIPFYRGKVIPLKDKPKGSRPANMQAMLEQLDRACDWMENERLYPERAALSDPVPEPLKLKRTTDKFGRTIRTAEEIGMKRRAGMDGNKKPPPRILLWSRKGLDRPCFIATAYLIRWYGIDLDRALNIVETARPGTEISPAYKAALVEFSKLHTKGELLCNDCITNTRLSVDAAKAKEKEAAAAAAAIAAGGSTTLPGVLGGTPRKAKPEPCYARFASRMAAEKNAADPAQHDPVSALGDASSFLSRILYSRVPESGWTNLLDLQLVSRKLGDAAVTRVFTALAETGCVAHLRVVSVKGNDLTCSGITFVMDCLQGSSPELMTLNLSCNKIQLEGACRVSAFVLTNNSVIALDVSSNPMGDEGVSAILQCMTVPRAEFAVAADGEGGGGAEGEAVQHSFNRTITSLDLGATEMGPEAAGALINVFRDNTTLATLVLDFNVELTGKDLKHVFNSLRSYNCTLQRLSLANNPLSAKSMGYLARVFDNDSLVLQRLDLSFCTLLSTHVAYLSKQLHRARCLTHLVLNSNEIGDLGGRYLATCIRGQADERTGQILPPLQYIDCSFCSMGEEGSRLVVEAVASRPTVTSLNMSYNRLGDLVRETGVIAAFDQCKFFELRLNGCALGSKGASALMNALNATSAGTLGAELRVLHLADNDLHDSAAEAVNKLLNANMRLEVLDLGFNKFTPDCADVMQSAKGVGSSTRKEKKLLSLHVNMTGNACDPFMLDMPGMARSKSGFRFGIKASVEDEINDGFSHVPEAARQLHKMRMASNEASQRAYGRFQLPINQISL